MILKIFVKLIGDIKCCSKKVRRLGLYPTKWFSSNRFFGGCCLGFSGSRFSWLHFQTSSLSFRRKSPTYEFARFARLHSTENPPEWRKRCCHTEALAEVSFFCKGNLRQQHPTYLFWKYLQFFLRITRPWNKFRVTTNSKWQEVMHDKETVRN